MVSMTGPVPGNPTG